MSVPISLSDYASYPKANTGHPDYPRSEVDLFVIRSGRRYGFEFKFADAPGTSKSMRVALADLNLEQLFIVYPGTRIFSLDEKLEAVPLPQLSQRLAGL